MPPISATETAPPYTEHRAEAGQTLKFITEDDVNVTITGLPKGRGGEIAVSSQINTINSIVPANSDIPVFRQSSSDISEIILLITAT